MMPEASLLVKKHRNYWLKELERVGTLVGTEGKVSERVSLGSAAGSWRGYAASVNALIDDLVRPATAIGRVVSAVANGDLSQKMALDIEGRALKGQFLQTANTINTMVYQLNAFAAEVTRVARSAAHGHGLLSESRIGSSPAVLRPIKALTGQVAVSRPVPRSRPGLVA